MGIRIAMVLFRDNSKPDADQVCRVLTERWKELPAPSDVQQEDITMSFQLGEHAVIIGFMEAPIPGGDLEGPVATSLFWPDNPEEALSHASHAIVTLQSEGDPIETSTLLTQATAALLEASPSAIGVYWGDATMVIRKDIFIDFATEVLPEEPPLHMWVDFRVGGDGEQKASGFTTGMQALGHMELEAKQAPEPPGELRERLFGLASYLLENGPVIKDGDTIGGDEHERIRVVYGESDFGIEPPVMKLQYETPSQSRPWWKLW